MANKPPAPSDKMLASAIPLPPDTLISCHIFSPVAGPSSQAYARAYADVLELARTDVYAKNRSNNASLTKSLLTSVHIGSGDSCMYVFSIGQRGQAPGELAELLFDGLAVTSQVSFAPADLYPCSVACSTTSEPCPVCQDPAGPRHHLPRPHLRLVYSHFLEAVRTRLIDDLSDASNTKQSQRKRLVKRFKGGFVLGPPPSSTEWSKGWETHASTRPLVYCQLQIHLVIQPQPQLIIHPQMHTTPFVGLPHGPGRPLPEGAPITLLPHGTPAFYLSSYSGPTSALRRQFHDSLRGLGVCGWDAEEGEGYWCKNTVDGRETTFVIAWINVENKQGEEKGITVIYPSSLCLAFTPAAPSLSVSGRREMLSYIPDLPPQLQPSPQMTLAAPSSAILPPPMASHLLFSLRPASCPATPSPLAMRSFRTLTLSRSKNIRQIASQVNGYVDSVAKERERERERMRREREREGGSPRLARANTSTSVSVTTPAATPAAGLPPTPTPQASVVPPPPAQAPQPVQPPLSVQNPAPSTFYPSPPQADQLFVAPNESRTSPVMPDPVPEVEPPAPPPQQTQPPATTFDPFSQSYMDMDIDMTMNSFGAMNDMSGMIDLTMDIDFGIGNAATATAAQRRGAAATAMDFETDFTDDDFSFFDQPRIIPTVAPLPMHSAAPTTLPFHAPSSVAGPMLLGFNGMLGMSPSNLMFGESPTAAIDWNQFTPGDMHQHMIPSVPELLPPTPGETPTTQSISAPVTPSVYLADAEDFGFGSGRRAGSMGPQANFEAIRFAETHRLADGKYAIGKFALPSPPPESDDEDVVVGRGISLGSAFRLAGGGGGGWGGKYASETDPRIGVVRKLIGVKRKTSSMGMSEGGRTTGPKMSPAWRREVEDWGKRVPDEEEEMKSEPESDEEEADLEEETPLESRPSTPPPAYLPLGPTLLHTHFLHAHLLPLCGPLRPPGSAVAPSNMTPFSAASASVPTPVSPAALFGATSEKSKSLEAAAFAIGREVVENSVWGEAWRTGMVGTTTTSKSSPDAVWPADLKAVAQLLQLIPDLRGPLDFETLFGLKAAAAKSVQTLDSPYIAIGKAEAVVQVVPSSLRFWDKLGLTPKGGRKDATVFVLCEDNGEIHGQLAEAWLSKVAGLYKSRNLGTLTPGKHDMCPRDGVFSMRFDSTFRKTLSTFVAGLSQSSNFVFYVCTPLSTMSLASPLLRQVFSSAKKALQALEGSRKSIFQFLPEAAVMGLTNQNPSLQFADLEAVCLSTYDRILSPVDRIMARSFFPSGEPVRGHFQDFAYSLARSVHPTVHFVDNVKPPLDVVDAGTFLHVGYTFSECGKWILCACVDQRGDAHDLAVWLTQTQAPDGDDLGEIETLTNEEYAVRRIWEFAYGFAKRANVAWRIVFAKLGSMGLADLDAWVSFLPKTVQRCSIPEVQVTLLSVEPDAPWSFLPPDTPPLKPLPSANTSNSKPLHPNLPPKPATRVPSSGSGSGSHQVKTQTLLVDVSSTTYAVFPHRHLPLPVPLSPAVDLGLIYGYVPEMAGSPPAGATEEGGGRSGGTTPISAVSHVSAGQTIATGVVAATALPHPLPIQPLSTTLLVRVPAASIASTPSMLHIDLLATFPSSSSPPTVAELHQEITYSFHELSVLGAARWRLSATGGSDPMLPFHLGAVDAMKGALGREGVPGG
ncbi:mediator complex subunit 13 C-terminal-domain-containing protein [Mycena amicta]|nr:mediator complex subunit 13 C-terminal-domain-containing protein [Mycena amicta]